jgi:cytochrome c peroxidase
LAVALWAVDSLSQNSFAQAQTTEKSRLAPLADGPPAPAENATTQEKAALGKRLFFDPRLSGENTMSCASCHNPEKAFGDDRPRAQGKGGQELARNTPSLLNVGYYSKFFWDGRAESLEQQALVPIQSPEEMDQDLDELEHELKAIPAYEEQFQVAFGGDVTRERIAQALAAFQRTLVTGPSPFDRYLAGDEESLSASAKRGLDLFKGEAGCIRCHNGPLLTDEKFYRLGASFQDDGLAAATGSASDKGKFRAPSLRNVAETAPYMHNGSMETLEEVVTFYYRGVPTNTDAEFPLDVAPLLGQSYSEVGDIVAFLAALSGTPPQVAPPERPGGEAASGGPLQPIE